MAKDKVEERRVKAPEWLFEGVNEVAKSSGFTVAELRRAINAKVGPRLQAAVEGITPASVALELSEARLNAFKAKHAG